MIERNLKKRIRMAFTSGGEEPVLDNGGGKHSVFAKSFLEVMKQISEPEGRYIFNRVSEKLALNTNQQPQYNPILNAGGERVILFLYLKVNNGFSLNCRLDKFPILTISINKGRVFLLFIRKNILRMD